MFDAGTLLRSPAAQGARNSAEQLCKPSQQLQLGYHTFWEEYTRSGVCVGSARGVAAPRRLGA